MSVFEHPDFDNHEQVVFCRDEASGLSAIIALHNTNRGPTLGGCRMFPYASEDDAVTDVLRLSRGMTYKAALADLALGGGKSVIIGDPQADKSDALLRAMGRFVERLGGIYTIAEDSGTSVEDLKIMRLQSRHVVGVMEKQTPEGASRSGDPSPATAYGIYLGILAAVRHRLGREDVKGLHVAIQGVGAVGRHLAEYLHAAGARLTVADVNAPAVADVVRAFGAEAVDTDAIFDIEADVFAPCALGGAINDNTLPRLRASVVAGAANNQLVEPRHGEALRERGILYAPDYVINAGGLIDVSYELDAGGYDRERVFNHIRRIADTLTEIFTRADREGRSTAFVADRIAEERFRLPTGAPHSA